MHEFACYTLLHDSKLKNDILKTLNLDLYVTIVHPLLNLEV